MPVWACNTQSHTQAMRHIAVAHSSGSNSNHNSPPKSIFFYLCDRALVHQMATATILWRNNWSSDACPPWYGQRQEQAQHREARGGRTGWAMGDDPLTIGRWGRWRRTGAFLCPPGGDWPRPTPNPGSELAAEGPGASRLGHRDPGRPDGGSRRSTTGGPEERQREDGD